MGEMSDVKREGGKGDDSGSVTFAAEAFAY